jgi:hypothetical protein
VGGFGNSSSSSGELVATTDGGTTWINQTPAGMAEMFGISCPSVTTCYAVGFSPGPPGPGGIMVTTDGGTSWSEQTVGTTALSSVACPSTTVCYAVGGPYSTTPPGEILETTNGTSWVNQTLPSGVTQLTDVSCVTATTTCMAAGLNSDLGGMILTNTTPPPTTTLLVPANGAKLSGSTYLDASASNASSVEFLLFGGTYGYSGHLVGTATPTIYGWLDGWNTTTVPNGSYVLLSLASGPGGSTYSAGVSITVTN